MHVDGGRERIHADVADAVGARLLGIAVGAPVFRIDRLGSSGDGAVEWRHTTVRADRFCLSATFGGRDAATPWALEQAHPTH